jgi:hypothetical protein
MLTEKRNKKRSFLMVNPLILFGVTNLDQTRLIAAVFFMNKGEKLINVFYTSFQARDWKKMVEAYHPEVTFYDPVFGNLDGPQVRAMWEMLLSGATELDLQFEDVVADEGYGSCRWVARYVFTATGRRVVNRAKARFRFEDGAIAEHYDDFSFYRWASQAFGWKGVVFGWTSMLQRAVRRKARLALERFMKK